MTDSINYQAVIADLEARRDQLNAAIAGIRAIMNSGAPDEAGGDFESDAPPGAPIPVRQPRPASPTPTGIQNDTFFNLSTPAAIRKYLAMMKRPQKVADIARALLEGGQIHARDATTAYNNVYAALKRMRKSGEGVRIKSGEWALAEWYSTNKPKSDGE